MMGHKPTVGHRALQCLAQSRAVCCKQSQAPAVCQQQGINSNTKEWAQKLCFSFPPLQWIMPSPVVPSTLSPTKTTASFPLFLRQCPSRRKHLLSLALIFPSYLIFISILNSLIFLFQMKQAPLEAANLKPRWQDFSPLQNIISSIPIHLPSKPSPVYMPGPGRESEFLKWLCCTIFLA